MACPLSRHAALGEGVRRSFQLHAGGGVLVLLVIVGLSIYKPRGLT